MAPEAAAGVWVTPTPTSPRIADTTWYCMSSGALGQAMAAGAGLRLVYHGDRDDDTDVDVHGRVWRAKYSQICLLKMFYCCYRASPCLGNATGRKWGT